MIRISIVTSLYKSQDYIEDFAQRIIAVTQKIGADYEIIFVNDCCPQNSLKVALGVAKKYRNIKVIDLAINANHHKALMTGFKFASGDYVFNLDVDLEEDPELLIEFWQKINSTPDLDLVYGISRKREGSFVRSFCGNIFYKIFGFLTDNKVSNQAMIRLMSARFVKSLVEFEEQDLFLPGVMALNGFKSDVIFFDKKYKGRTTYSFMKRVKLSVNAITAFSSKPLVLISYIGAIVSVISFSIGAYIIVKKLLLGSIISGWSSLMVSIWMVGGIIILCLGVIAIYLSKIFIEIKKRPYSVIKKKYGFED